MKILANLDMIQQLLLKFVVKKLLFFSLIAIFVILFCKSSFSQVQNDWRAVASGNWSDPTIWQIYDTTLSWHFNGGLPNSFGNVVAVGVAYSIVLDGSVSMDQLLIGGTLTINPGGTLNIVDGAGNDLTLSGTITGAGDINISATAALTQGILSGTGALNINSGGSAILTGNVTINRIVNNNGLFIWTSGGVTGSGTFNNNNIFTNQTSSGGSFGMAMVNNGTLNKTTNNLNFFSGSFQNPGAVSIQSGGILLGTNAGSATLNGTVSISSGGTLQFGNNSNTTYTVNASISGAGTVVCYTTAVNLSNTCIYNVSGVTTAYSGTMTFLAGMTLTNIGDISPAGGNISLPSGLTIGAYGSALRISAGGTFTSNIGTAFHFQKVSLLGSILGSDSIIVSDSISFSSGIVGGTAAIVLNSGGFGVIFNNGITIDRTFINNGTITWSQQSVSGSGTFINNSILNMTGTANGCFTTFTNNGTVNKSSSLVSAFGGIFTNSSSGIINITNTMLMPFSNSGANSIAGSVNISAGATFQLGNTSSGTYNISGSISGAGNFYGHSTNVNFLAGSVYNVSGITGTYSGNLNFNSGMTVTNIGSLSTNGGTVNLPAGLVISSLSPVLTLSGGGTINFNTGQNHQFSTITTNGTIAGTDTISLSGNMTMTGGMLTGNGPIRILSGAILDINSSGITVTKTLNNSGTINWTQGGISGSGVINNSNVFNISTTQNITCNPVINNTGTIHKGTNTTPFLAGGCNSSGTINVTGGTLIITPNSGTFTLGGILNVSSGAGLSIGQANGNAIENVNGQISGAGNVNIGSNTVNFGASCIYNITGNSTVTFGSANFNSAMTLTNLGNFISTGGTTNFSSGLTIGSMGSNLNIAALAVVNFNTGKSYSFNSLDLAGTIAGTDSAFINSSFNWTNGTISNVVVLKPEVTTTLNSGNTVTLSGKLINNGKVNWIQGSFGGNGFFINNNLFNINTTSTPSFSPALLNNATVNKNTANINSYSAGFTNNSVININSGGMSVSTGVNYGTINLSNNTTFSINGLFTSYGTIVVVANSFVTGNSLLTYNGPSWVNDGNVSVNMQFDSITSISGSGVFNNNCTMLNGCDVGLASNMQFKNIVINSGSSFNLHGYKLSVTGTGTTITNNGTFNLAASTVEYNGSSAQVISNNGITYKNLIVNNPAGTSIISGTLNVEDTIKIVSGFFNLNNLTLSLGSTGYLVEGNGTTVRGTSGTITATRTLNSPVSMNVAGLGATITSSSDLGSTTISRGFAPYTINGSGGIKRYYNISPANNTSLNATLVYHFDNTELNGLNKNLLSLYRSTNSGTNWTTIGGQKDTANNNIIYSGINSFSYWTAANNPLAASISITAIVDALYNTSSNTLNKKDTVTVYLRNSFAPYAILDSSKILLDTLTFTGTAFFNSTPSGTYYISMKYRNAFETWTKSGGESYSTGTSMSYDFTTAQSQAYGNSTILRNGKYCIISGDINLDGFVNGNDFTMFSQQFGQSGYLGADLNGDNVVNGNDFTSFSASFGKQSSHP